VSPVPSALPRALTRKAVVLPLAAIVLLVGAFEGYGAYTRSKPVSYSRGGNAFAAPPGTSTQPSSSPTPGASASTAAVPSATSGPSASAASAASAVASTAATSAPVADGPSQAAGPRAPAALAVPAVGTYRLTVKGSEKVKFGAVSFCNQSLPSSTSLVVTRAATESPTSYDFDLRYFPGKTGQHDERHIYRYTPAGTYLDYENATVTCQGVRQSSETSYSPPQLRTKGTLAVGQSWTNHGGDADRTETATSKVLRRETLTVGGRSVATYVIQTTTSITGSESGSRGQTWWYSPEWAMPLKWTERIDAKRSGAAYSENVTVAVTSHP
jgi:hypothetical protein